MQIHISQTTKDHLEHDPYVIEERGKIFVKVSGPIPILNAFNPKSRPRAPAENISQIASVVRGLHFPFQSFQGKGYMKTYWLKGKKDLSFKTPTELRYSGEQKDLEDISSNG